MKLIACIVGIMLYFAASADSASRQTLIYYGIYCQTGKNFLNQQAISCRPRFGNGYGTIMSRQTFMLYHNGQPVLIRRNR